MKKILSITIVVMMIALLSVPAFAADDYNTLVLDEFELLTLENDTTYLFMLLSNNSVLTINSNKTVKISDGGSMSLDGGMIILKPGACLIGSNVILGDAPSALIRIEKGAKIDISFYYERDAIAFRGLLSSNAIECVCEGNRIVAPCTHENIVQKKVCIDCGHIYSEVISSGNTTGFMLSEGNLAIIMAVAGVAFGFVCGLLIGKKKKKSVFTDSAEEEIKDNE